MIGGRLVQLQGVDRAAYAGAAAAQRLDTVQLHALRGEIVDRFGTALAYTTDAQDITADPQQIAAADRASYALKLAPLVGRTQLDVLHLLAQHTPVRSTRPSAVAAGGARRSRRSTCAASTPRPPPSGSTRGRARPRTSSELVHSDGSGGAGIEYQYNNVLAGHDGSLTYAVDGQGNVNPSGPNERKNAVNGGTVRLTIDQDLQFTVQKYLDAAVRESGARGAQAAVLDAHTGQVLALAANGTLSPADHESSRGRPAVESGDPDCVRARLGEQGRDVLRELSRSG